MWSATQSNWIFLPCPEKYGQGWSQWVCPSEKRLEQFAEELAKRKQSFLASPAHSATDIGRNTLSCFLEEATFPPWWPQFWPGWWPPGVCFFVVSSWGEGLRREDPLRPSRNICAFVLRMDHPNTLAPSLKNLARPWNLEVSLQLSHKLTAEMNRCRLWLGRCGHFQRDSVDLASIEDPLGCKIAVPRCTPQFAKSSSAWVTGHDYKCKGSAEVDDKHQQFENSTLMHQLLFSTI